jgi:hypothetical protein
MRLIFRGKRFHRTDQSNRDERLPRSGSAGKWIARAVNRAVLIAAVGLAFHAAQAGATVPENALVPGSAIASRVQQAEAVPFPVRPLEPARPTGWIDWNGANFFGPCRGDCAISIYGGKEVTTGMTRIFYVEEPHSPPWEWRWRNSYLVAATFSRRLVSFFDALSIEPELGIGQRFGQLHATEFWGALTFRWSEFPWNNYLRTSIALTDGFSLASAIDPKEATLDKPPTSGSHFLNFFSPSITFALPEYEAYELMFRWHHRSGVFRRINDVSKGAQFWTTGLRVRF